MQTSTTNTTADTSTPVTKEMSSFAKNVALFLTILISITIYVMVWVGIETLLIVIGVPAIIAFLITYAGVLTCSFNIEYFLEKFIKPMHTRVSSFVSYVAEKTHPTRTWIANLFAKKEAEEITPTPAAA